MVVGVSFRLVGGSGRSLKPTSFRAPFDAARVSPFQFEFAKRFCQRAKTLSFGPSISRAANRKAPSM